MTSSNTSEGVNLSRCKTETSPLKETTANKYLRLSDLFSCWDTDGSSSLKTIVVILFGTTGAITLALFTQIYYGEYEVELYGSVTSDSYECSQIGVNVLKSGGNAVDAAIATAVCLGVVNFHITGLGGGGYLMLYNHRKHKVLDIIDFREAVPVSYNSGAVLSEDDGSVVGVPGFIKGLYEAHQRHGQLAWKNLITPSLNLAKYGFIVSDNVMSAMSHLKLNGYNSALVHLYQTLALGKNVTMPDLALTLDLIASKGVDAFYSGPIAMDVIHTVTLANGTMSLDDILNYKVINSNILRKEIYGFDVFVPGSSSGGALLLNSMHAIEALDLNEDVDSPVEVIFKLSDTLHDAYLPFLQKTNAVSEQPEAAASQISVVDSEENYVTIVSGLDTWLGSQLLTGSGFILNSAVTRGGINEEKRPISLGCPIIAVEKNEVCGKRYVLGSGDVTVAAQLLTNLLIFKRNTSVSIESPRFMIDNVPRHIRLEGESIPTGKCY